MGLPLPDELIGLAFNHLDIPSLLRCSQVCKLFHSIISENTYLTYKTELFASYMEDGEHSSVDTVTRLDLLREYNGVWNDMRWTSSGIIPMLSGRCWEFSGGILAQSMYADEIFFVQLPCKLKGIAERRWTVPFDFRICDFTLDSSQDLIILMELSGEPPNASYKVHLRTLLGEPHPCSTVPQITHALGNVYADFSFLIQICGDRVAVLFYDQFDESSANFFVVWNWRTGRQEVYICTPGIQSFAFMTEDLILAGVLKSYTETALRVLSIAACADPVHSLEDMPYVCELLFPELKATTEYFVIRSDPTPTWRPPASLGVPFHYSRKDFVLTISIHSFMGEKRQRTFLLVPLSTLLSEVERSQGIPHRNVAWDEWGTNGTRMIGRERWDTWFCHTYGMKFAQVLRWKTGHVARVYDFNPFATRKHVKTSVGSPLSWRRLAEQSQPSGQHEILGEEVTTTLPGRVINFTLEQSDTGWDAVMVGEDNILMVQSSTSKYGYMAM